MCVWKVKEKDRMCQYCCYRDGCERYPVSGRMGIKKDSERMIGAMNDVIGDDILKKSRLPKFLWGRYIVSHQLRLMGYSYSQIASVFGQLHPNIINSEKQVTKMLQMPQMYKFEKELYDKFQEQLKNNSYVE